MATDFESPEFFAKLKSARDADLDRATALLPDMIRIDVITEANVCVGASEWRDLVLLGQCIAVNYDGPCPDLDEHGAPRWSWSVGQENPDKGRRMLGDFRFDIASAIGELQRRLKSGSRLPGPFVRAADARR